MRYQSERGAPMAQKQTNVRLDKVELAAAAAIRQRLAASIERHHGTAVFVSLRDAIGTALVMHERVTRGDLVTLRRDGLTDRLERWFNANADELYRNWEAAAADALAREGITANVLGHNRPKADRDAISRVLDGLQAEALMREAGE